MRANGSGLMARIFRTGKENTAARYEYRARISTLPGAEKTAKPGAGY
jgi:hypothetical protein